MFLSAYERRARLTPGLLGVSPVAVTIVVLGLKQDPAVAVSTGLIAAAGGSYVLSLVVGNFGRSAERVLYETWGGRPTEQLLRTRSSEGSAAQRDIWRQAIQTFTGVTLLDANQELADPVGADNRITAAINQVRYLGQESEFPILAAENAQYGLERNLYGFRWVGRFIAFCFSVVLGAGLVASSHLFVAPRALISGLIINVLLLAGWIFLPSASRTKAAGFRYANQLLQAVVRRNRPSANSVTSQGSN